MEQEPKTQVFNRSALLESLDGNNDIAYKLIHVFLADVPDKIQELKDYLNAGNAERVSFYAHRIKGSSSYVYGDALRKVAGRMEQAALLGDLASVSSMLNELQNQYDMLEIKLTKFLNCKG